MIGISEEWLGGGPVRKHKIFEEIIALKNLFSAWNEFRRGKESKADIQKFSLDLEDNLFILHEQLITGNYRHSEYSSFFIHDPKLRHIHKADVLDRVFHHAVMRVIEPVFENTFIFDSYASRKEKGTHRAVQRLQRFAWKLSRNNTKTVWILKCDIKKFFDSVDHKILIRLLKDKICDSKAMLFLSHIIRSFEASAWKGIPLGNVTSQLFSNIYLDPLDQFLKRKLKVKYYLRYADDFVMLSRERIYFETLIQKIEQFLKITLHLSLHPQKITIRKWHHGIDFLGYVCFPYHIVLRTKTKRRMLKKLTEKTHQVSIGSFSRLSFYQSIQSYLGILKHCRGYALSRKIAELCKQ